MKTINDVQLSGKRVFIRVDFNVPLDDRLQITDDTRIKEALPTIQLALKQKAKVIIASHLGRPKGKKISEFSLLPAALCLEKYLDQAVTMADDCIGPGIEKIVSQLKPGEIIMLENLRFHAEEEQNDESFAKKLALLCDVYVNDAFAVSHRSNASVAAITKFAPVSVAGLLLEKEIRYFEKAMKNPDRPLAAVVGGAKVSTKLAAIQQMLHQVDKVIIGGAMANTFLAATGLEVGKSKIEPDLIPAAKTIMEDATRRNVKLYLPVDVVVADRLDADAWSRTVPVNEIPTDLMALDIGPDTVSLYAEVLRDARTIVWNGPMGAFETAPFSNGTMAMVNTLAESDALTIVGGGDTDVAVHQANKADKINYISTGGGAFLSLLEGKQLPALVALENAGK